MPGWHFPFKPHSSNVLLIAYPLDLTASIFLFVENLIPSPDDFFEKLKETSMRIALHGSYFGRNFGDTLLVRIFRDWVRDIDADIECGLPVVASTLEAQEIGADIISDPNSYNGLVYCGGGYFGEPPGSLVTRVRWAYRNWQRHLRWKSQPGYREMPYCILGVGVGPVSSRIFRAKVVNLFNRAEFISVRDETSRNYLDSWGVKRTIHLCYDAALSLNNVLKKDESTPTEKPTLIVHLPFRRPVYQQIVHEIAGWVSNRADVQVICLLDSPMQDRAMDVLYKPLLDAGAHPHPYLSVDNLLNTLQSANAVITAKLHVGIAATALDKPVLSIPYHSKTYRFYEQIDRLENCWNPSEVTSDRVLQWVDDTMATFPDSFHLPDHIVQQALVSRDLLKSFLNEINTRTFKCGSKRNIAR